MHACRCQADEHPVSQGLPDHAGSLPAPRGNEDSFGRHDNSTLSAEGATKKNILHESEIRKSSQEVKQVSSNEQALVAVN
jgi:hypothetical protein